MLTVQTGFAQLTGTKNIPGDYATIQDAVTALNTSGVGAGGVTFNVAAAHTEMITAPIIITATGVAGNAIVFQKVGVGPNALVRRTDAGTNTVTSLGAAGDAVIRLEGTDYITFDGIDISTDDQGIEYGYMTHKNSGTDGCQNVTIKNSIITMTKGTSGYVVGIYIGNGTTSLSSSVGVTVTDDAGKNADILITGNTIQNVHAGVYVRGSSASGFKDVNITVGQNGAGNSIQNFGGGSNTSTYGIYFIYVNNPTAEYNIINNTGAGGTPHASTLYGTFYSSGIEGAVIGSNNNISLSNSSASSGTYYIYSSNTVTSNVFNNNTFGSSTITSTGTVYLIYSSNSTNDVTISGNTTSGIIDRTGASGTFYCYYNNGSPTGIENIFNNTFSNINLAGSATFYGILSTTGSSHTHNIYSNTINDIVGGTGIKYGIHRTLASGNIYDNSVYNVSGGGNVYGISSGSGNVSVYENNIYNLSSSSTGTTVGTVTGIYVSGSTNSYFYNNFISDLQAPTSASADGVRGIGITSTTASSNIGLYYNSIFLNATSTGTNFGTSGIFATSSATATSASLDMRNNIVVNKSTPAGTGVAAAYRRSSTTLTNLNAATNNNCYYAGVPSASNLIFYDGTNSDQTIADYKTRVTPIDAASVSENAPFINSTVAPYNLHLNSATPTQLESGGIDVSTPIAVTNDFDGDVRNATTPDIGADEFAGVGVDLSPPLITYTPLDYTSSLTNRTLTATITDVSGVTTGANGPRLYYKKINDVVYQFDALPVINGDDYTFTINNTLIGGVAIDDSIVYYVAAQDVNGNAGTNPGGGSGSNPPGTTAPANPNYYRIVDLPLSGTYTVGLTAFKQMTGKNVYFETRTRTVQKNINGIDAVEDFNKPLDDKNVSKKIDNSPRVITVKETYKDLMENGKPFDTNFFRSPESRGVYPTLTAAINDLNLRGVSGPVTFSLVDSYYPNETYPIDIYDYAGASETNTVTIKPAVGVVAEIPGDAAQTGATLRLGYGRFVVIDGSNTVGGATKDLKVVGLATGTFPAIHFWGDAHDNIIKNVVMESQNTSTGSGTLLFGSGPFASDNNLVENCTVKNIDTVSVRPGVGVYFFSTNTGTGNQFKNLEVYDFADYGFRLQGAPTTNTLVSGCEVYMTSPTTKTTVYGAYISRSDGLIIQNSKFIDLASTSPSTVTAIYYPGNTTSSSVVVRNNFISLSSTTNMTAGTIRGIDYWGYSSNTLDVYYNSVYIGGTDVTGGTTAAFAKRDASSGINVFNNIFFNARSNISGTGKHYAAYANNITEPFVMDYNDLFANGTGGFTGYWSSTDQTTLADWITASGKDSNSINVLPPFSSITDLHIPASTVTTIESAGIPIAGITIDIDDEIRNTSTPDLGADEFSGVNPLNILNGDYYIPKGANPQGFATLESAITALNNYGVSGQVRFLIDDNLTETGANLIISRNDLTETNNLIIKPAPAKTPVISISGCVSTSGASQYSGIGFNGASFITFDGSNTEAGLTRDLTISMNDSLNGRIAVTLFGNTDNIVFKNLNIKYNTMNPALTTTRGIYGNGQASGVIDSLIIENCQIGDMTYAPAYAISITGSSGSSLYASKTYIRNNQLYGTMRPVYFFYGGAAGTVSEVSSNIIQSPYAPASGNVIWGILFNTYNGTFNIYGNKLQTLITATTATNGVYGIGTLTGQAGVVMNIYNNFLGGNFQHNGTGVPASVDVISFQDNIPQANVSFNTIVLNNINKPTSARLTGVRMGGTANVNLKNNIVINENDAAAAYALYVAGGTLTSDYNDLYTSGATAKVGYYLSQALQTFSAWQDTTGKDLNSVNVSAPFTSAIDFHIPDNTATPLESAGIPVAGISTDIDAEPRSASNPDIGADEFNGFSPLAAPSNLMAITNQIKKINLSWTDNTSDETGFVLERKLGDSLSTNAFGVIANLAANSVAFTDTLVQDTTLYTYRIKAVKTTLSSPYSNLAIIMTLIPVELTSFVAEIGEQAVNINWSTATEKNNSGFDVERKLNDKWEKLSYVKGQGTTLEKTDYTFVDDFKFKSHKGTIEYRLRQIDYDGTYTYSKVVSVDVDFTPKEYTLYQNYPNPFNPSTTLKYALPFDSNVKVKIYSMTGELVEELVNTVNTVGIHDVQFNAGRLASGVYIYSIEAQSLDGSKKFSNVKKMMLLK
ncbi:MAG: hypothetical protein AUK34_11175 [Ignavibacteria bacterium CG2_30_36_16]|nr:MAG: hypothetical protein AUK34_11175 [Ignavibacteria bacterium CG2_30_36_16]PJB01300.1 MAG: hypothetical protein CO127_04535 [Ignavibacteria bacterium CG_4_9_14_3_um_filter_36_18]